MRMRWCALGRAGRTSTWSERAARPTELIEAEATAGEVARLASLLLQDAAQQQLGRAITVEVAALDSPRDGKLSAAT